MTRIKICGLTRMEDVDYVNQSRPDFCGFILGVPGSRRNVDPETAARLRRALRREIVPVGVFVDADPAWIASLVRAGTVDMVQLHGQEDGAYLAALRREIAVPVIQAFSVASLEDVKRAEKSAADHILLDHGKGGTGQRFDWSLLHGIRRPYILAGGLTPENLGEAVRTLRPWAVDLSSGVETAGRKDMQKIRAAVAAVRDMNTQWEEQA